MNKKFRLVLSLVAVHFLSACGGGGSDHDNGPSSVSSSTQATTSPTFNATSSQGMWAGTTSTGRDVVGLLQADGTYWVLYTKVNDPSVIAGAVQGNAASNNGVFTSTNGRDFNVEAHSITDASIAANYTPRARLDGSITYYGTASKLSFTSTYDVAYDKRATLQSLSGDYSGSAAVVQGAETARLTIDANGGISGRSASGCAYTGQATPQAQGSAFTLTVIFAGGNCANGTDTVRGVGYLDPDSGVLYGAALNNTRSNGLIFSGKKAGFTVQPTTSTGTSVSTGTSASSSSSSSSSDSGCGSRGGPGYRLRNGKCASWADARAGRT